MPLAAVAVTASRESCSFAHQLCRSDVPPAPDGGGERRCSGEGEGGRFGHGCRRRRLAAQVASPEEKISPVAVAIAVPVRAIASGAKAPAPVGQIACIDQPILV